MAEMGSPRRIPLNGSADLQLPLRGCVICCTSVPDEKRSEIAQWADQMGAIHRYDLTLDVTHLIIADCKTDKYQYVARERQDVQPMTVQWIEAIRELWMDDKDIDFAALETKYRLPTFHSLKFSMTGCDDPHERLEISEQVKANGATYEGDLTKQITHLISFRTEGAKYKAAKSWGLKIVSVEWLRDSIERGMILDEKLYDPALPIEERGKGAWDRSKPKRTSLGKRSREGSAASFDGGRRKLRRTASMKLNNQNADIWGDIVGGGPVAQVSRSGVWDNAEAAASPHIGQSRAKDSTPAAKPSSIQTTIENPPTPSMFSGCRFYIYGFSEKKEDILRTHLTTNGAEISNTIEELVDTAQSNIKRVFRIVSPDLHIQNYPMLPTSQLKVETITFWWVERCLHSKKFIEPNENIIGRPFPSFPIEGFNGMTISSSAFSGIEIRHVKEAVELIGAKYSEEMTAQTSVLITKTKSGLRRDKSACAQEWNTPILIADWLWDSIESGSKLPWSQYKLRKSRTSTDSLPATTKPSAKPASRPDCSKSKDFKSATTSSTGHSSNPTRPPRNSGLDDAFADDEPRNKITKPTRASGLDDTAFSNADSTTASRPTPHFKSDEAASPDEENDYNVKEEQVTQVPSFPDTSTSTQDLSMKAPPLSERSVNSPTRTISTAPLPSDPPPKAKEDISNAITTLLAKTRSSAPANDTSETTRRRGGNRILGRVTSNLSNASTNHSRGTSVDSSASHGHPVQRPSYLSDKTANEQIDMLINDCAQRAENVESQTSSTQVGYEDPESVTAREIVMARMSGKVIDPKKIGLKVRAPTIADYAPRTRRRTGRGAGAR